jgi:hypothetical protein
VIATQMEATFCCAYDVPKARKLNLRILVADCAGEPFKLMKILLDGVAQNPEAAFWLTNLQHSPQIVRIFPLDFAYLDSNLKVVQGLELPPGVPLPKFHPQATSALILPLNCLAANGIGEGDRLIICSEEELEAHLSELTPAPDISAGPTLPESLSQIDSTARTFETAVSTPRLEQTPFLPPSSTRIMPSPAGAHGSGFTAAITSTWQVATATTASLVLEPAETQTNEDIATDSADVKFGTHGPEQPTKEASVPGPVIVEDFEHPEPAPLRRNDQPPTIDLTQIGALERALANATSSVPNSSQPSDTIQDLEHEGPFLRDTDTLIARSKEAAEKAYVKVAVPTAAAPSKPKRKSNKGTETKKDHIGNRVVRWLALDEPLPERRKIIRLLLEGLQAYDANGESSKRYQVRDICPPGIYIRADEPWQQGDLLSLVLLKQGATDSDHEHRVSVQARVVRRDNEGVGVAFVFPEGTEFQPWQRAKTKRSDESEADFILRELRLARALGFLRRLCPWSADELNHALLDRLSNKRVTSAVEIALKAEDMLLRHGHVAQPFVAADLLIRIVEGGSWIEEDWIRRMWAGLLVSSCSADGQDRSNLPFIDLLARLTPIHLRILSFVCHRGVESLAAVGSEAALDLYSTAEELMEAADSHSFPRIQQTISQLSSVGLLAETVRPSYVVMSDRSKTRTTPTSLGLKMYARCNGHRS